MVLFLITRINCLSWQAYFKIIIYKWKKKPFFDIYKTKQEAKELGEFEIRSESIVTLIAVILGNNNERCHDNFCFYQEKKIIFNWCQSFFFLNILLYIQIHLNWWHTVNFLKLILWSFVVLINIQIHLLEFISKPVTLWILFKLECLTILGLTNSLLITSLELNY